MQHGSEEQVIPGFQVDDNTSAHSANNTQDQRTDFSAADTASPPDGFTGGTTPTVTQNPLWTNQGLLTMDEESLREWLREQGAQQETLDVVRMHRFSGEDLAYGLDANTQPVSALIELEEELKIRNQPMLCVKLRRQATKALIALREEREQNAENLEFSTFR